MHKSEQKIERTFIVEGPNDKGQYAVKDPDRRRTDWKKPSEFILLVYREVVAQHIESLPKPPSIWTAYLALRSATRKVVRFPSTTPPLHEHTPLTEDEAITLMELLNKITEDD